MRDDYAWTASGKASTRVFFFAFYSIFSVLVQGRKSAHVLLAIYSPYYVCALKG